MSDQTGDGAGGAGFVPPSARRPADAGGAAGGADSSAFAWAAPAPPAPPSPYAPPSTAPPSPYAPPSTAPPSPYAPPGASPTAASGAFPVAPYGPYATPPAYGSPAGYGAPPPPAYGVPAHGAAPAYGLPAGPGTGYGIPAAPPTDGLATASLVTSVGGLLVLGGLPGPVGIGLGIGALRRIRRRGTRGRGLAVAGVAVGAVSTLVFVGLVWLAVWGWSSSSGPGAMSGLAFGEEMPDYTLRADLVAGDCLQEYPGSWDLGTASPVDCAQAHAMQIVAVLPLPGPVDTLAVPADAGYDLAFAQCAEEIERAAPGLVDEWTVWTDVSFPHPDDWSAGGTTAYCAVATDYPDLQGSVLDGSVTGP